MSQMWPTAMQGSRGTTMGTTLTAGAANTKGAWVALTSAMPFPCDGFTLSTLPQSPTTYLLDLAVGAAGSEVVILPNVCFNGSTVQFTHYRSTFIPLHIPMGARVSGRIQAITASAISYTYIYPWAGPWFSSFSCRRATNYGANTADSGGVTITPTASVSVFGPWTQLSAAIDGFTSCLFMMTVDNPAGAYDNANMAYDIGVGAAAAEQTLHAEIQARTTTTTDCQDPQWVFMPLSAKSGERLTVRGKCDITTADRITDVSLIGFQ